MSTAAKLFRVTLEVADLESATDLYRDLLDIEGKRHPGARHDRPWGERSFYVVDPWGNDLCFCQDGTLYT